MCWGSSADAQASPPGSGYPCPLRQAAIGGVLRPRSWGSRRSGPFCHSPPPTHTQGSWPARSQDAGGGMCQHPGARWASAQVPAPGHVACEGAAEGAVAAAGGVAPSSVPPGRVAWAPLASGSCFSPRVGGPRCGAPAESACPAPLPQAPPGLRGPPPRAGPAFVAWQLWWPTLCASNVAPHGASDCPK